uniref:PilZ domain-containing protein n=1 Tax=Massilia sp. METH4 TaxID=3123041 RepID=UPI00403F8AAC
MGLPQPLPENRQDERRILRVRAIVRVAGASLAYDIRTENVSAHGIAVRMPLPLPDRTKVEVSFTMFAGNRTANLSLAATVVHTRLSGDAWLTGLSITDISVEHRKILSDYCSNRL